MKVPKKLRLVIKYSGYWMIIFGTIALSMLMCSSEWPSTIISSGIYFLVLYMASLLSRYQPYDKRWQQPQQDKATDWLHLLISTSMAAGIFQLLAVESNLINYYLSIDIWPNQWPWYIQLPILSILAEFGGYWSHRAMHTFDWLNRVHSIHHSAKRLYPLNATRNHPLDFLITLTCTLTPLMMLGVSEKNLSLVSSFFIAHLVLQHANVEFNLGIFDRMFNLCKLHKWHHLPEENKQFANFGNVLLIWDHVFATYNDFNQHSENSLNLILGSQRSISPHYLAQLSYPFESKNNL